MTNETNAALSAALEALHVCESHFRHLSDEVKMTAGAFAEKTVKEAIALLESSQREAPVAEGVMDLAHELWAMAQLAPGEGIEDGAARIARRLDTEGLLASVDLLAAQVEVTRLREALKHIATLDHDSIAYGTGQVIADEALAPKDPS